MLLHQQLISRADSSMYDHATFPLPFSFPPALAPAPLPLKRFRSAAIIFVNLRAIDAHTCEQAATSSRRPPTHQNQLRTCSTMLPTPYPSTRNGGMSSLTAYRVRQKR